MSVVLSWLGRRFSGSMLGLAVIGSLTAASHAQASGRAPAAAAQSHLATCDEIPGVTDKVTTRWRFFYPLEHGQVESIEPELWVCHRSALPAKRVIHLGMFYGASRVAGNLVQLDGSGRYNSYRIVLDLVTLRYETLKDGATAERDGLLLGSGVIVEDARTVPPFGGDDDPGAGFYSTAPDGSIQRTVPSGPPVSSAGWARNRAKVVRGSVRIKRVPGLRTTLLLGSGYELRASRARGGRSASLSLHAPTDETLGRYATRSDLLARLVVGSEADLQVLPSGLIIGRFADHPSERRMRLASSNGKPGTFELDLPAPAAPTLPPSAGGYYDDIAVGDGDHVTLILRNDDTGRRTVRQVSAPGARDLTLWSASKGELDNHLVYTDADGHPVSVPYRHAD